MKLARVWTLLLAVGGLALPAIGQNKTSVADGLDLDAMQTADCARGRCGNDACGECGDDQGA